MQSRSRFWRGNFFSLKFYFLSSIWTCKLLFSRIGENKSHCYTLSITAIINPISRWGRSFFPLISFCWITFFCKNRINLKLLDFLSYTFTHMKSFKFFYYSSVDNRGCRRRSKIKITTSFTLLVLVFMILRWYPLKFLAYLPYSLARMKNRF